jgi:hypothetical protein
VPAATEHNLHDEPELTVFVRAAARQRSAIRYCSIRVNALDRGRGNGTPAGHRLMRRPHDGRRQRV